jgi:hypothetical protein
MTASGSPSFSPELTASRVRNRLVAGKSSGFSPELTASRVLNRSVAGKSEPVNTSKGKVCA